MRDFDEMRRELVRDLDELEQAMGCLAAAFAPVACSVREGSPDVLYVVSTLTAREYRRARRLIQRTENHARWYAQGLEILAAHSRPIEGYPTFAQICRERKVTLARFGAVVTDSAALPTKRRDDWPWLTDTPFG